MLDAYIIERIRRQREERRDGDFVPLRIEVPTPPALPTQDQEKEDEERPERGSVVIDFRV